MGLFGPKKVSCPAGQWTFIIRNSFVQMPAQFVVTFEGAPEGEFEEVKSSWIFPGAPRRGALAPKLVFERGYWNTFYKVRVHPRADVVAVIQ